MIKIIKEKNEQILYRNTENHKQKKLEEMKKIPERNPRRQK